MNQNEESKDNLPEVKVSTFSPPETEENPVKEEQPISAPAQIVEDISANPAEVIQSAFAAEEKAPESAEAAPAEESVTTPETVTAPEAVKTSDAAAAQTGAAATISNAPSETGVYQLLNAMVDKPYKAEIDLQELKIEKAKINPGFTEQAEKLGLTARRDGNLFQIEGTPTADAQGEHTLQLDYTYDDEARILCKKFVLLINPDPKSLWKNLEPDEALPFRKDHQATETVVSDYFKIVAASRRGRSHAHEGKFREDDFAVKSGENGWHILIVADGAGSAALSRQGSRLACETAMEFVEKAIREQLEPKFESLVGRLAASTSGKEEKELKGLLYQVLCGAAFAAYKRLEQESATTENPLKDYSTTLLMTIVKKCAAGFFIASFGIGDGAIGVYTESPNAVENEVELMNLPDGGEFSGQTRFLTMREVIGDGNEMLKRIKFKLFDKFTILALMSDGISDPKFGTDNNLVSFEKWKEFVVELLKEIDFTRTNDKTAEQLLEYMNFWSPGEHDDRTLAILY